LAFFIIIEKDLG